MQLIKVILTYQTEICCRPTNLLNGLYFVLSSPPCPGRDFCFYRTLLPIPVRLLYLQGNSGIWKEFKAFQRWTTYEKVLQAACNEHSFNPHRISGVPVDPRRTHPPGNQTLFHSRPLLLRISYPGLHAFREI